MPSNQPGKEHPELLSALEGSLSEIDVQSMIRDEREAELTKDGRWS